MHNVFKVLFVIAFHFPLISGAATMSEVGKMAEFFHRIDQEGELVDQNYFVSFSSVNPSDEIYVKDDCFEATKSIDVVELVDAYALNAIEILYGDTEKFAPMRDELNVRLQEFGAYLKDKEIQMCTETSTPSYSDGHTSHYVKVDGVLSFIFEEGYPD